MEDTQGNELEEVKAELETVRAALKKANSEAKGYRERVEALEADDSVQVWKTKAVHAHIRQALKEEGVKDVDRVLKVMSLEGVELDDKDALTPNFSENLKAAQKEWPELFDKKARVAGQADIFADGKPAQQSTTEQQVARLTGGKR